MPDSNTAQDNGLHGSSPTSVASPPALDPDSGQPSPSATVPTRGRLLVLLFVFVCAAAGVLLVILPWTAEWTDNILLLHYPDLRSIITNGFFRGICSGLGLLDIWIGFSEAVHYHEDKLSP